MQLEDARHKQRWLLLLPDAAGLTCSFAGQQVLLVSPQSPMGQALRGRVIGDEVLIATGASSQCFLLLQAY